jgi:serine phosphatase RsbU (regulator of sigma subunit)
MIKSNNHHSSSQYPIPSKKRERIGFESLLSRKHFRFLAFLAFIVVFFSFSFLYFLNLLQWSRGPDFGWSISHQIVGFVFVEVYGEAEKAGLQVGDRIVSVNDVKVDSYSQVQQNLSRESTEENRYEVERQGQLVKVRVPNKPLGFGKAFQRFGLTWVLGLVFFSLGVIVFSMKPGTRPSWAFLIMMFNVGLFITFMFTSKLTPAWLNFVLIFAFSFLPASFLQLTQTFPVERPWVEKHLWSMWAPYVFSMIIFLIMISSASRFIDVSPLWKKVTHFYLICSILLFLASNGFAYIKSSSVIAQMRSKVILIGSALAIVFPVANLVTTIFFQLLLFRNPIFNLPFFIFFPLSIAYAIAKHNLFDIDAIIKRTYGYILTTGTIVGLYGLVVLISNLAFARFEITKSPLFPLVFVLAVVFFFNPIRNRVQKFIDRVFYRLEYDYQETVQRISEALRSLLHLDAIGKSILNHSVGIMFIESGSVMVLNSKEQVYESITEPSFQLKIPAEDPLIEKISTGKNEVTLYDIQEDPLFEKVREECKKTFGELKATLIVPLIYENRLTGLISLGGKKSGKFYTREDINLLKTLANQGAVAIENARLFEENIEKSRMEEELKIAHNIQLSMLPEKAPTIEGFSVAARSIPAREVGGDFYDFIEIADKGAKRLGIVVGDVSGKAVSGALVMAASRSIFRVLTEAHESVEEVMNRGNARLHQDVKKGMFVALLYAVLDPREKTLTFTNAGQVSPVLFSLEKAKPEYIDTEGDRFPLGIIKECDYQPKRVSLKQGDILVFYTDGMVEAVNDKSELYGFERFLTSIEEGRELGADELLEKLINDVMLYAGKVEQHDDLTAVVVKVD